MSPLSTLFAMALTLCMLISPFTLAVPVISSVQSAIATMSENENDLPRTTRRAMADTISTGDIVGSPLTLRSAPHTDYFTAPHSPVHLLITIPHILHGLASAAFPALLTEVAGVLYDALEAPHYNVAQAGPTAPGGNFNWQGPGGVSLHTWNTNRGRTSWSILCDVVMALSDGMAVKGWGPADFVIFVGMTEVGRGRIG